MVGEGEQERAGKRDTRALEVYPHPSTRNWGASFFSRHSSLQEWWLETIVWRPLSEGFNAVMHDPF